jgi:TP901-1 family phage major tail protein
MAILNGTDIKVYDSSTNILVAYAQNGTLNVNHSVRDITNKESSGWKEVLEGLRDWSISLDGAYAWTDAASTPAALTNGADDILNSYIITRAAVTIRFGNADGTTSNIYYEGSAWLDSFSVSAPTEDTATYSLNFTGTAGLTQTVS